MEPSTDHECGGTCCSSGRNPIKRSHVRIGSFCDINAALVEVCFVPYSGRITQRQLTSA